jgi:endonuclease/exonuclease/phosphatase family metal-dependent hydrolase
MTWNTLYGSARTPLGGWAERSALIAETVRAEAPDILALQEFQAGQIEFARTAFPGYAALPGEPSGISHHPRQIQRAAPVALLGWGLLWWWLGPPPWSFALTLLHAVLFAIAILGPLLLFALIRYRGPFAMPGEYLPIVYRPDRVRPLGDGTVWFSRTPAKPGSMFPLLFEPRIAHWALFEPAQAGPPFLVVNAHLGHAPWHHAGSARVLVELIARERPGLDAPVFLAGDFNAVPEAGVMRRLRATLTDAWSASETRDGPATTFQWCLARGMTPLQLDHVLFAGPVRAASARVLTPRREGRTASDHDPVSVLFEEAAVSVTLSAAAPSAAPSRHPCR